MAEKTPEHSISANVEVSFREIDALHDLSPGTLVVSIDGRAQTLYKHSRIGGAYAGSMLPGSSPDREPSFKEDGSEYRGGPPDFIQGVYRGMSWGGNRWAHRIYESSFSRPIREKYVYVFQSKDKNGSSLTLQHELKYDGDKFFEVSLESGKDREVIQEARERLHLDFVSVSESGVGVKYFFAYLAPFQLPWSLIESLLPAIEREGEVAASSAQRRRRISTKFARRCARIDDPFFLGHSPSGALDVAKHVDVDTSDEDVLRFVVYLFDPFREALRRCDAFNGALESWYAELGNLQNNSFYTLAKKVYATTVGHDDLFELGNRVEDSIREKEALARRLSLIAEVKAEDVICWLVGAQKASDVKFGSGYFKNVFGETIYLDSRGRRTDPSFKATYLEGCSYFSEACRDYYEAPDVEDTVLEKVLEIVEFCHRSLAESRKGRGTLKELIGKGGIEEGEKPDLPPNDGGVGPFFEGVRKSVASVNAFIGGMLETYSRVWVHVFRAESLTNLKKWISRVHGIELNEITGRRARRAFLAEARSEFSRANMLVKKHGTTALQHKSVLNESLEAMDAPTKAVVVGIEAINLAYAIRGIKADDPWTVLGAFGSTLDAYDSLSSIVPKMEVRKITYLAGTFGRLKVSPLAFVSGSIDTVLAARDAIGASNTGQSVGHAMRSVGAAMTVGGAVSSETGVGAILMVAGVIVQASGSFIVSNFDDYNVYYRHCYWAVEGDTFDKARSFVVDRVIGGESADWYPGKLSEMKRDIDGQHAALDRIAYSFECKFSVKDRGSHSKSLHMSASFVNRRLPLVGERSWSARLEIGGIGESGARKVYELEETDSEDQLFLTAGEPVEIVEVWSDNPRASYNYDLRIKGRVSFRPYPGYEPTIEKEIDETIGIANWDKRIGVLDTSMKM